MTATVIDAVTVDVDGTEYKLKPIAGESGGMDEASKSHTALYDVWRSDKQFPSIVAIYEAIDALIPATFAGMGANSISYREEDGTNHFLFTIGYNLKPAESTLRWSFDTTGGNVRLFTSKATTRYAISGRTAPDFKNAIGVKNSGKDSEPEGVDIVIPGLKLTATFKFPKNTFDLAAAKSLSQLTGTTNNAAFYTFAQGELLFLGATGEIIPDIPTEIRFDFLASQNATGLTIGDITGVAKKGHEYLWVAFEANDDTSAKKLVQRPLAAYVERVYGEGDFSLMGIGIA